MKLMDSSLTNPITVYQPYQLYHFTPVFNIYGMLLLYLSLQMDHRKLLLALCKV